MERIHVSVRARPLSPEDAKTSPWRLSGNSISTLNHSPKFEFDRIFGDDCKTLEVYQYCTRDIVAAAVRGFNGTVFAYGQTNSGKTHTMRGSPTEPGVIPLAVRDLFNILQEDVGREFLLRMSYMEIYNEEINDLLAPEHRRLQIHENLERGIYVAGLREEIVASPEQVLSLMENGESHRHIGETNMNVYSSRSHTIFRMIIESRDKAEDEDSSSSCDAVRVSVLNLVDLAGSERAAKTGAEGVRLKEGSHINKSLMTLGTVIKKLSEGAESQGGHVPYRDSKLTRILQPALGGNANTAIICNITLAQIHADETKSSLQFASRALRVTNCAHVNEILTDAALLKRQKKEIEELRAKLQGSQSEHLGEEILNLRNTLLQTELERERIALELEEEKKAQAEREKRLQEQAKKIENLSSMVLNSNRDENQDLSKKKRRVTWCPGKLSKGDPREAHSTIQSKASALKPVRTRSERDMGPLLPFKELMNETEVGANEAPMRDEDQQSCSLPNPSTLLHVTNRRKVPVKKKRLPMEDRESIDMQAEYEDLFIKAETQRTLSDIQIDCLYRKLAEMSANSSNIGEDKDLSLRESGAIGVIKQLEEQIKKLELEKSLSQQNLYTIPELVTEQNVGEGKDVSLRESEAIGVIKQLEEQIKKLELEKSLSQQNMYTIAELVTEQKIGEDKEVSLRESEYIGVIKQLEEQIKKLELEKSSSQQNLDTIAELLTEQNIGDDKDVSLRESESIGVIKQLEEQIKKLELEKSSSHLNLDTIAKLAMKQNICAKEKLDELYQELLNAKEEARAACEQLTSIESVRRIEDQDLDSMLKLACEVQEIVSEIESSNKVIESVSSLVDEVFQTLSSLFHVFHDFKGLACESSLQQKMVINNHEKLQCCMRQSISDLENDKLLLYNQSVDLQKEVEELQLNAQSSDKSWTAHLEQQDLERNELVSQILTLQKEVSSSSFGREKEVLRKDLEKVKAKLKETESKLKNALQEKTKLESDRAISEREMKRLQGQKTLLERDISKRDSVAGRRRESVIDRSSKPFDSKMTKGLAITLEQTMQEDYKKLEVLAFEMETTIASLEEELAAAYREKEEVISTNERLESDMEALSEQLNISNLELNRFQEEISGLELSLEESNSSKQKLESSVNILLEEKEELAMQLSNALLEMEEEKAIWSAKEKASMGAIEEKAKLYSAEVMSLSKGISEARNELESCRAECEALKERLTCTEENEKRAMETSGEKSVEIDQLKDSLRVADAERKQSQEALKSELDVIQKELAFLSKEREDLLICIRESDSESKSSADLQNLENELQSMTKERDELMNLFEVKESQLSAAKVQVEELTNRSITIEGKMHMEVVKNNIEKAKLIMRLRGTQAKLEAMRYRHKEAADELNFMNRRYEEASKKLKEKLASSGLQILNLQKQLAVAATATAKQAQQ